MDSDVSGDSLSGASFAGWEWFPASEIFVVGFCGDVAVSPGGVSTVVLFLRGAGGLSWSVWSSMISSSILGSSCCRFPKPLSSNLTFEPITIRWWRPSQIRHCLVVLGTYPRNKQRRAFGFTIVLWASGTCRLASQPKQRRRDSSGRCWFIRVEIRTEYKGCTRSVR